MISVPGWITKDQCEFHLKFIEKKNGRILEVGTFGGRLFNYLQPVFPGWKYHAVNAWTEHKTYIPADSDEIYRLDTNVKNPLEKNLMTIKKFKKNCPYAKAKDCLFEKYTTTHKFDIVSMGQINRDINWYEQYTHALTFLQPKGIIIARNLSHPNQGQEIRKAIKESGLKILEIDNSRTQAACMLGG